MNKILLAAITLIALAILVFFLTQTSSNTDETISPIVQSPTNTQATIATEWQWSKESKKTPQTATTVTDDNNLPFTAESVYNALQAVKLDKNGDVILDHDALIALDEALERIHDRLDSDSLESLKKLIQNALPGLSGEQTAKLVENYYNYLEAKQEFSQINEALANESNEETIASVETDQALYAELQSLRETHLGYQATQALFRVSDANANYMFESMKLERDDSLSAEEKIDRREALRTEHIEQSVNILNWPSRYQAFLNDKRIIVSAAIGDEEKQKQLNRLLNQHFSSDEITKIDYLGLDQP